VAAEVPGCAEAMPTEVQGRNGVVSFDGPFVTINRKGFVARATVGKGEKRIPVGSISAVQLKPAGPMMNAFIQFTMPGGNERSLRDQGILSQEEFDVKKSELLSRM